MTIVESIVEILKNNTMGMTSLEIHNAIVAERIYVFGAKNPVAVVNNQIRRRCEGLNFPTAYPVKLFKIVGYRGKKPLFLLISKDLSKQKEEKVVRINNTDLLPEEKIDIGYR